MRRWSPLFLGILLFYLGSCSGNSDSSQNGEGTPGGPLSEPSSRPSSSGRPSSGPALENIVVSLPIALSPIGLAQHLTALGTYSNASQANLTSQVVWSSSHAAVATVDATGLVKSKASGQTMLSASLNGIVGTTSLNVTSATLLTIGIQPASPRLPRNYSQQLTAIGTCDDASQIDLTPWVDWNSSSQSVATVNSSGEAVGLSAGVSTLSAQAGDILGTTSLIVTNATLVTVAVTPANPACARATTLQLGATGTFSDSSSLDLTTSVAWSSSQPTIATIDSRGLVSCLSGGSTQVRATRSTVQSSATLFVGF